MSSTWPATGPLLLLLLLSLYSPTPACSQQVGYEYIQSVAGGVDVPSIFLNLWGTLGGCGAGTSDQLYVNLVTGSILGMSVVYPLILNDDLPGVTPDNCVNITGRTLSDNGLGLLYSTAGSGYNFWQLYNSADSSSSADNYVLLTAYAPDNAVDYTQQLTNLLPPRLIPLTSTSAGPSVGLLFNGGFEQTLLVNATSTTERFVLPGWTGNYTAKEYGTADRPPPGLPGQTFAGATRLTQRRYVSLLPGTVDECPESAFLHANCSANSLSQSSLPLTLGLQYSLSWYASCGLANRIIAEPCSFSVTTTGPTTTTVFAQTNFTWLQHKLVLDFTSTATATTLITFTPLTGNPVVDSVLFTYATTQSDIVSNLPAFPEDWYYGFIEENVFAQPNSIPFTDFQVTSTDVANVTDYSTVSSGGLFESGAFVHTYQNYSWVATSSYGLNNSNITAVGGRNYTFSLRATAFAVELDPSIISLSVSIDSNVPGAGTPSIAGYTPVLPPLCTSPTDSGCNELSPPHSTSTRRRLLQVTPFFDSNTVYYSCSDPTIPCNNSLLTVTLAAPTYLVQYFLYVQIVVYNMDIAVTNLQLTSVPSSPLPILGDSGQPSTGGVIGDPQFTGLLGQRFQVHGVSGTVYNIITDSLLQVNARFDFLSSGGGPRADIIDTQPWTHQGTYLGAMSFQTKRSVNASHVDVVVVEAGGENEGFARVSINGQQVTPPYTWQPESNGEAGSSGEETVAVYFTHSHVLEVQTSQFHFRLVNSDRFINQEVAPRVPLHAMSCHGLLGQTRLNKQYKSAVRYIEGSVDDYAVATEEEEGALISNNFVHNRFGRNDGRSSSTS